MTKPNKGLVGQMAQFAQNVGEAVKDEAKEIGKTAVSQVTGTEKASSGGAKPADPRSGRQHCYSCHDLDNSPAFNFETYWPLVEHYEDEDD